MPSLPSLTVEIGRSGWLLGQTGNSELGSTTYLGYATWDDITSKVLSASIRRGRQHELDRIETGTAALTLLNQDGAFNPTNTSSPYWPDIRPMVPLRIRAVFDENPFPIITGLHARYDFSDISTLFQDTARTTPITADGQVIKGITDLSGNGFHLSEATNGPTYEVGIQNGQSVARFDGTNDELAITGMTAPVSGWTLFSVFVKTGALTTSADTVISYASNSQVQLFTDTDNHATGMNYFSNQAAGVTTNVATGPLSWGTKVMRANSTSSLDIYTGGGTPINLDPTDTIFTSATALGLAHNVQDNTNYGDYDIGEVIIYNVSLSAADMNLVGDYLAIKWAVPWTAI